MNIFAGLQINVSARMLHKIILLDELDYMSEVWIHEGMTARKMKEWLQFTMLKYLMSVAKQKKHMHTIDTLYRCPS